MAKRIILAFVCAVFFRGVAASVSVGNFNDLRNIVRGSSSADIEITVNVLRFNENLFITPANSADFNFKSAPLSGASLFSGDGLYSGFSFQNKSFVSFENISFEQMVSAAGGAAFRLINSSASFSGETSFYRNQSYDMGGAFEINGSSVIFGNVNITSNSAKYSGGGFLAANNSTLIFDGAAKIFSNHSLNGGGFRADASKAFFSGASQTVFQNNSADFSGGGFAASNSDIIFDGNIEFSGNSASQYGGAGYFESSTGVFTNAKFYSNSASAAGGALYISNSYVVIKSAGGQKSVFEGNTSNGKSEALSVNNSSVIFQTETASSIEMRDGLKADENSALFYFGEGSFELYGDMSQNYGDLTIAASAGGSFDIKAGGVLNAKILTNAAGSELNAANGQADIITAARLNNEGTLSLDAVDKIKVKGDVSLGGKLEIFANLPDGDFRKAAYKIIDYGGHILSSSAVLNVVSGVSFSSAPVLDYGNYFSNRITLILCGNSQETKFLKINGLSFNQTQTAGTFDILSKNASGDLDAVISFIEGLSENSAKVALNEASGFFIANIIRSASLWREKNLLFDRIQKPFPPSKNNGKTWIAANFADFTAAADNEILSDYNDSSSQITAGYDIYDKSGVSVGIYAGYSGISAKQGGVYQADISNTSLGFYGGYFDRGWEVKAVFCGDFNKYRSKRYLAFIEKTAEADFDGNSICANLESVYKIKISREFSLKPFINLNSANSSYGNFKEKGADSLDLNVKKGNYFRSDICGGLGISQNNYFYNWQIKAESAFLLSGQKPEIESFFDGDKTGLLFKSRGNEEDPFSFGISAAADLSLSDSIKLYAGFGYRSRGNSQEFNITGGISYNFD